MITDEKEAAKIADKAKSEPCIMSLNVMTLCYDVRFDAEPEIIMFTL